MQISNDVKRPLFVPLVVPKRRPLDDSRLNFLRGLEDEDVRKAFSLHPPNGSPQLRPLLPNHMRAKVPVLTALIPLLADPFRQIEYDGDRKAVVLPAKLDQRLAGFGLNIGGIDDGETAKGQPLAGDEVQNLECVVRHRLLVFVVRDYSPAIIRRQYLGGPKVLAGEGALARATGADEDDEGEVGDGDGHKATRIINFLVAHCLNEEHEQDEPQDRGPRPKSAVRTYRPVHE